MNADYLAYSDESGTGGGQFTSIASFSFRSAYLCSINKRLSQILNESGIKEFKWSNLKYTRYRLCAEKLINAVWGFIYEADARIDILTWDNQDSRNSIKGRDDSANFGRMFFHLHSNLMKKRPQGSAWCFYPDEKMGIDWSTIKDCLEAVGRKRKVSSSPLFEDCFNDSSFSIAGFEQVHSHEHPSCQIADLFAGLGNFSHIHCDDLKKWRFQNSPMQSLFPAGTRQFSKAQEEKCSVLQLLVHSSKKKSMSVKISFKGYIYTRNSMEPINFWFYEPQHKMDKAPIKTFVI